MWGAWWFKAKTLAARLRGGTTEAEAAAASALRASAREAERDGRVVRELQRRLERQKREALKAEDLREKEAEERKRLQALQETSEPLKDLEAELQQCEKMRWAESKLAARLEESRARSGEIEKKAMNVAQELANSSKVIAWLQAEVGQCRSNVVQQPLDINVPPLLGT